MNATQAKKIKVTCDKCNGTGYLAYHANVENSVCFPCGGSGEITVRKNDRKPGFDWNEYHAKKITFIINLQDSTIAKMSREQINAMDYYVYMMTMDRKCMWLYYFYVDAIWPKCYSL